VDAVRTSTLRQVTNQLQQLGVRVGGVLLVHTSFRAVGPMDEGPRGLLKALRLAVGAAGTIVMPTMTDGESLFSPEATPPVGMGITADLFWRSPGVLRSGHPTGSFAAQGPLARVVCAPQPLCPPHGLDSPPGRVLALGGQVLLLGVGHSESTILHVAEALADVPYRVSYPCKVEMNGCETIIDIPEIDHCCRCFARVDDWLRERSLQSEGVVGNAHARLISATEAMQEVLRRMQEDQLAFLCAPTMGCSECDRARASIPAGWNPGNSVHRQQI